MTDSGGSIQPYQPKDGEVLAFVSEGYAVVSDDMADRYGVDTIAESGGIPAANVFRASDLLRDYRDGTEGGGA